MCHAIAEVLLCDEALRVDDARMHIFDQTLVRSQFVGLPACRYVLPSPSLGASLAGLGAGGLVVGAASVTAARKAGGGGGDNDDDDDNDDVGRGGGGDDDDDFEDLENYLANLKV